jgi:hypothetical protein
MKKKSFFLEINLTNKPKKGLLKNVEIGKFGNILCHKGLILVDLR